MEDDYQQHTSGKLGSSPFFVGVATPSDAQAQQSPEFQGALCDPEIDHPYDAPPKLAISLAGVRMIKLILATSVFFAAFTVITYYGIIVESFTQEVGADSSRIEERVKLFNAISGFILAFVEVGIGLFVGSFVPALLVYLHNSLWFMHQTGTSSKLLAGVRSVVMFVFPVFLMLLIGNSVRSLQAAQSTAGFETIITLDDLRSDPPVIETVKASITKSVSAIYTPASPINDMEKDSLGQGPLQTAVDGSGTPFIVGESQCSKLLKAAKVDLQLSEHDLDSVMTVFGFDASEWISEVLDTTLVPTESFTYEYTEVTDPNANVTEPTVFDARLAFEMFGQAKVLLDKSLADTDDNYVPCSANSSALTEAIKHLEPNASTATTSTGSEAGSLSEEEVETLATACTINHLVLSTIGSALEDDPNEITMANLVELVGDGLEVSVEYISKNTTVVKLESYDINTQLSLQTMQIDVAIEIPTSPFFTSESNGKRIYEYENWGSELCGSDDCVFLDLESGRRVPQQVVLTPYQSNCSFTNIDYLTDLRGFFPRDCKPQSNSAVAFSTSTYITADEYGSNITEYDPSRGSGTPYLVNPRRWLRIVVAKLTWKSENLAQNLDVGCRRDSGEDTCTGLSYRLPRTGRYLFSSDDALPTRKLIEDNVSLVTPLRLLQVNEASLFLPAFTPNRKMTPERLDWRSDGIFKKTRWTKNALEQGSCSMLIDSYIRHVTTNQYYLDRPYSTVYRAAFAYIFSNGSVTDLKDTSVFVNGTDGNLTKLVDLTKLTAQNNLDNIKLKGDVILREIRVQLPTSSFNATMIGCGLLVLLALLVVFVTVRRVEYFPPETSKAEEFIEMSKDEKYPDVVHDKMLYFPESGKEVRFSDLKVDRMTLRHRLQQHRQLHL